MKFRPRFLALALLLSVAGVVSAQTSRGGKKLTGEQIYRQRCAACHGPQGEGSKQYGKPLTGDRSVGELARFIAQAMPPGPGRKCTGEDAQQVAQYLHGAFYSPVAQARLRPARIEVSHITVRQYRNLVADLVGSFRPATPWDERRGLRAEYFRSRRFQQRDRLLERVDPDVQFDWGTANPTGAEFDPHQFSIRWQGSVLVPDTGEYEFVVRTEHAARLWVNDLQQPVVDAWVKSGSDNEFRASLFLVGGRAYPVRLEFSKANQGVDDSGKLAGRPVKKAALRLDWRPPKRAAGPIPRHCLLPGTVSEGFVVTAAFPPDDRSMGYERSTTISKEWNDATTEAALETAGYVVEHLRDLSGAPEDAEDRPARLREFCRQFVSRAFRRPLTDDLARVYVERPFEGVSDPEAAVRRVVLGVLKSPRFLLRDLDGGAADGAETAVRLALSLWDSLPDAELTRAAAAGELATPDQVARQAERMAADPRARAKLRDFFLQWLKVDGAPELQKDPKRFPVFDPLVASDLRTSLELTLDEIVSNPDASFDRLWTDNRVFLNERLARLYGAKLPAGASFQAVDMEPEARSGVLTHPYVLASFAYADSSSPIHRGVLIARNMLGRLLRPPQQAFTPLSVELHPNLTTRERVQLQTGAKGCQTCHGLINPLGFTLERFDAIGRLRQAENGKPVDVSGAYQPSAGSAVRFADSRALAQYVVQSSEAHAAFAERLFQFLVNQPLRAFGPQAPAELSKAFEESKRNLRSLVVRSVTLAASERRPSLPQDSPVRAPSRAEVRRAPRQGEPMPMPNQ